MRLIYMGVLLGLGIMAAMVYLALDKKSNLHTRIAALVAIALMLITVIICLVLVFTDNTVPVDESVLIVGAPAEVKEDGGGDTMILLLLIIFLIAIFILIALLAMRENRKNTGKGSGLKL